VFGGSTLGVLPEGTHAPPIVAEAFDRAKKLRLVVGDSQKHRVSLDVRRQASARARSRFFWMMAYVHSGFATRSAGPDYLAGRGLGRMREEWEYAWTPLVEARLIELTALGATLNEVALRLLRETQNELSTSNASGTVASIVAQATLIGLEDEVSRLLTELERMIEKDNNLDSVLGAVRQLRGLWRARDLLEFRAPERLLDLADKALPQLAYLFEQAAHADEEREPGVIAALITATEITRDSTQTDDSAATLITQVLQRLQKEDASLGIQGAALALGVASGNVPDKDLSTRVKAVFAQGADSTQALRFFRGVMQAAPDLFIHTPELFEAIETAVLELEPDIFLEQLPGLRQAFLHLRPLETAKVAEKIAAKAGVSAAMLTRSSPEVSARDLDLGVKLERKLLESLARDCLPIEVKA
ncbi:MAG: DUF5682 family protein, partial [Coriobacteriia bacterium]|nr:DUF5682 family protein [Coriobacteriia bacterium]